MKKEFFPPCVTVSFYEGQYNIESITPYKQRAMTPENNIQPAEPPRDVSISG